MTVEPFRLDVPEPGTLAGILHDIRAYVLRYVVVTPEQATTIALWAAHTHAINAADATPYMQVTSATAEAGKTRLLETLDLIVARPWLTQRVSAAALVRKIDAEAPTLLLDESDAAFNGEKEYAEALRGLLNSGYRRSGKATLCVGQGANLTFRDFATFSVKMIAGIGKLPDTVASRSIRIELRRRTKTEPVAKFRERDARVEADPIRAALAAWAPKALHTLRTARPSMPAGLRDRAEDVVEPLLAIADLAGAPWSDEAQRAVVALMGTRTEQDINVELLHDIFTIFEAATSRFLTSTDLIKQLTELDDRPWTDWKHGRPITPRAVAERLKGFGIFPVPSTTGRARGYYRDRFEDAWTRYPPSEVSNRENANKNGPEVAFSKCQSDPAIDTSKTQETPTNTGLNGGLTLQTPDTRGNGRWAGRLPGPDDPPFGISRAAWARHHMGPPPS